MRIACPALAALLAAALAGCTISSPASPDSDAPERQDFVSRSVPRFDSYSEALTRWRSADDVNAWIGANFEYDMKRALQLSETQRARGERLPILQPEAFFRNPRGVCVDVARFGVETLRAIDPASKPAYVMIEFDPISLAGNTLRRHWIVSFERDGQHYFFADSKRPGYIAGPYASTQAFIDDYARYRRRHIVAFREVDSYERKQRTASRNSRPSAFGPCSDRGAARCPPQ